MKKINIGGIPHELYFVPETIEKGEDEKVGESDLRNLVIKVANFGPPEFVELTLVHELIHCAASVYHLRWLDKPQDPEVDDVIDLLALGLMTALRSLGVCLSDYLDEEQDG